MKGGVPPATPAGPSGTNLRTLAVASGILVASAMVFSWQMLYLSASVGQFTKYTVMARQVLAGTAPPERILDFSPLYLGLHIFATRLFADSAQAVRWIHVGLLSFTAPLLYFILRRHAGLILSLTGVAAFALAQSVMIYGHVFEPEPLMVFFLVALVFFVERDDRLSALAAGASFTLCLLTRPSFAPLLLVVPVLYLLRLPDRRRAGYAIALFLIPVMLGGLFVGLRNYRLQGRFSLVFMSPGTVFFDGNNPLSSGAMAVYPPVVLDLTSQFPEEADYQHAIYRLVARADTGTHLTPGQVNRFWAAKALNYISDYPGHFLTRTARRAYSVFHSYRWHDLFDAWSADRVLSEKGFHIPFAPVAALALPGLIFGLLSWRRFLLPCAVFLNQAVLMTLTYTTDRQRVCLYPFFVFFAVLAVTQMHGGKLARRVVLVAVIPLTFLFSVKSNAMLDESYNWEGVTRAGELRSEAEQARALGNFPVAVQKFSEALAYSPSSMAYGKPAGLPVSAAELARRGAADLTALRADNPSTRLDRAILLADAGQFEEAEALLHELQRRGYTFQRDDGRLSEPAYYLGRIAFLRGRVDQAAAFMNVALETSPGDPSVLGQLACLTDDPRFADQLRRYFDRVDADFYMGRACLENRRPERALEYLERIGVALPTYERAQYYRAAALGAAGHYQQAAILFLAATGGRPDVVLHEEIFLPVFEQWARDGSPEALFRFGVMLRQYGYFPDALAILRQAVAAGHQGALNELRNLELVTARM